MRLASKWLLGTALVPVLCLTACTSDKDPAPDRSAAPSHQSSAGRSAEKKLTEQAQSALDSVTKQDESMVESGVERVSDGIHTQPDLSAGHAYKLTVVCAGKGTAEITFTPRKTAARRTVSCDRSVVSERFTAGKQVRIDTQGKPEASGMIAWRLNSV
ncbi:hypothetical protein AB0M86_31170 [Streptomyces sp. NPDC051639]|uniref:hypothetical protein n=1 Tax=unclassified Streptomyces TaxID=2593676 RepID=UPI002E3058F6|nr:hypothetical protein [Streptomyces sp. NBC_01455]